MALEWFGEDELDKVADSKPEFIPPGATSTTTPAGITANDPNAITHSMAAPGIEPTFDEIQIPLNLGDDIKCSVQVAQDSFGWRAAVFYEHPKRDPRKWNGQFDKDNAYEAKPRAILAGIDELISDFANEDQAVVDALARFRKEFLIGQEVGAKATSEAVPGDNLPPASVIIDTARQMRDEAERARQIREAEERLLAATIIENRAERAYKIAKKEREEASEEYCELADCPVPPNVPIQQMEMARQQQAATEDLAKPDPQFDTDQSWRTIPLAMALDLVPEKQIEAMAAKDVRTMGELADWTAGGKLLTDFDGIGKAKAEKIEDATVEFWKRWNLQKSSGRTITVTKDAIEMSSPSPPTDPQKRNAEAEKSAEGKEAA